MRFCVLLPDYSTSDVDYQHYDPPRDVAPLLPEHTVHTVFLNKLHTYRQLLELSARNYDCFVNLCEGYPEWSVPSIDVVLFLERLKLPFTGPTSELWHPPKPLMKHVAHCAGVAVPEGVVVSSVPDWETRYDAGSHPGFPVFVKPAEAGDSLGIDESSYCSTPAELRGKLERLLEEYPSALIEEYVAGREFTVLVSAGAQPDDILAYRALEYVFPPERHFKTYALKTSELHGDANLPCDDADLDQALRDAAVAVFRAFQAVGYARMDFRVRPSGEIVFLEVNFTCSVFYDSGYEGSADHILNNDPNGKRGFLLRIIEEGMARFRRAQPCYELRQSVISGYAIMARRTLPAGTVVFKGEERAQRIATKRWVERNWTQRQLEDFRHYAYPISDEVYILWDEHASNWAPMNHSCEPNTRFDGLNVVTVREVQAGEELTLDWGALITEEAAAFECHCGAESCRGWIAGSAGNSVTAQEQRLRQWEFRQQPLRRELRNG